MNTYVSSKLRIGMLLVFAVLFWLAITQSAGAKELNTGLDLSYHSINSSQFNFPLLDENRDYLVPINKSFHICILNYLNQDNDIFSLVIFGGVLILVLIMLIRNYMLRITIKEEKNKVINHFQGVDTELEATHKILLANKEELNRQFIEIQKQKDQLKISRERYQLAADGSEFGIWDIDFIEGKTYMSDKGLEIIKIDSQLNDINWKDLMNYRLHPEDKKNLFKSYYNHIKMRSNDFEVECRICGDNEEYEWINIKGKTLFNQDNNVIRMAGSVNNISKAKHSEEKIKRLAFYDVLTGLPNRTYFEEILKGHIGDDETKNFALLLMDIDNFKVINDSFGHSYGDKILVKLASILNTNLRADMELFRFGGDEFILLISNTSSEDILKEYVTDIIDRFQNELEFKGLGFFATVSIGISIYPEHGEDVGLLLKRADMALNEVKSKGKNGYEVFSSKLDKIMTKRLRLESDLRQAILNNEFELYYQPKVITKERKILGYEALIRWNHKGKKIVAPSSFIPVAEETGMIIKIGEWVIMEAIDQLKDWHDEGHDHLSIAINLSSKQLKDVNIVNLIERKISETGIDATKIELEITETTALTDITYSKKVLHELKKLGIKISLDDFGTGYSALNYLTQLPIDTLKIDKSFIKNSIRNKSRKAIIKSVIKLAHECKMMVVAEGVETKSQFDFLEDEQCDIIQGYYFSEPVPNDQAIQLLSLDYSS